MYLPISLGSFAHISGIWHWVWTDSIPLSLKAIDENQGVTALVPELCLQYCFALPFGDYGCAFNYGCAFVSHRCSNGATYSTFLHTSCPIASPHRPRLLPSRLRTKSLAPKHAGHC